MIYSTIYFNISCKSFFIQKVSQFTDTLQWFRNKCLSAKSRFYRHDQKHLCLIQIWKQYINRCLWFNRNSHFRSCCMDFINCCLQIFTCFIMNCNDICSCFHEFFHITDRFCHHEMNIQCLCCCSLDRCENRHSKGNAWNEHSVHHIKMNILCACFFC